MAGPAAEESSGFLDRLLADPLLLEAVLVLLVLAVGLLLFLLGRRFSRDVRSRRALGNLVEGMDAYLRGRWEEALPRLEKALEADPENLEARVALGDCLRETGRVDEAERLHLEAIQVFGDNRPAARLGLARDLLLLQRPREALEWIESGTREEGLESLELAARALEMLGRHQEAARRLERLLDRPEAEAGPGGREALRRRIGGLLLREAEAAEGEGRLEEALALFRRALSWNSSLNRARAGVVALLQALGREEQAGEELRRHLVELDRLAEDPEFRMLPWADGGEPPRSGRESRRALPCKGEVAKVEGALLPAAEAGPLLKRLLAREALFICRACEMPLSSSPEKCPSCGALGRVEPLSSSLTREIEEVDEAIDEIEENQAYIKRLIGRLCRGGEEEAAAKLERVGERALPVLYAELCRREDREPLFALLRRLGPAVLEPLLEIHREARREGRSITRRLLETFGNRRRPFCEVAAAFGPLPEAKPFFLDLCHSGVEDERRAVMDYLVGAARPASFEGLQGFARAEVINFLSDLSPDRLVPLLLNLEREDFLIGWMLQDRTLQVEESLVQAFAEGGNRPVIGEILRRRGFHPGVERSLQSLLCHEGAREEARRVMASFGEEALPHRLPVLLDPDYPAEAREILGEMVLEAGEKAVSGIILECLGTDPSPVDEKALDLIGRIGARALPVLNRIYREEEGIFAKFPLVRNRSKRRRELVMRAAARFAEGKELLTWITGREQDDKLRALGKSLLREKGWDDEGA